MLVIPTHVALAADDPEFVRARGLLGLRLKVMTAGDEAAQKEGDYLASAPYREDDGTIAYVHVFRIELFGRVQAIGIPAAPGWWPVKRPSLMPPRRTPRRAKLRLVS